MAIALVIGIGDLLPEFLADALILLAALQTARAITAGTLQAFLDRGHHFLVFIQTNCHKNTPFLFCYYNGFYAAVKNSVETLVIFS